MPDYNKINKGYHYSFEVKSISGTNAVMPTSTNIGMKTYFRVKLTFWAADAIAYIGGPFPSLCLSSVCLSTALCIVNKGCKIGLWCV